MEMIKDCLEGLDYLEEHRSCSAYLKDQIKTLKIDLKFLRTFLVCQEALSFEGNDLMNGFWKTEAVIRDVKSVILTLKKDGKVGIDLQVVLSSVIRKIELIKPEIHEHYQHDSLRSAIVREILDPIYSFVDCVLENRKDVLQAEVNSIVRLKTLINTLERRLRFLISSLQFAAKLKGCFLSPLLYEIRNAAIEQASFFLSCWIEKDEPQRTPTHIVLKYRTYEEITSLHRIVSHALLSLVSDARDAVLVSFVDFLLQQLAEMVLCPDDDSLATPTKNQFESIAESLRLGRYLLTTISNPHADLENSYRQHLGARLNEVVHLIEFHVANMHEKIMAILVRLMERLKLINFFCMVDRVNHTTTLIAPVKDQLETLHEDIQLLGTFYYDTQKGNDEDATFRNIYSLMKTMALEAGPAIYSFHVSEDQEGVAEEMRSLLPHLLEKIKLIKADMRKIYSPPTSSDLPMTADLRGTTIFLKKLNELLNKNCYTITRSAKPRIRKATKDWIENLQNELEFLISFLENSERQHMEIGELKALEIGIMNMATEAKYATERHFLSYYPIWYCMLKFSDVMEEVELIKKEMERINEKFSGGMLSSSQDNTSTMGEVIVGFEDEAEKIIDQLIGEPELHVTSIVGMGGLGKTTLARKLYNHPSVVDYFHIRAWCCISQVFEERSVLLDILRQVDELPEEMYQKKTEADLQDMLHKSLKGRRYLIVMDDIWDIKAWTAIRRCFDDDYNGSRIIFTTRLGEVALKVRGRCGFCHNLRFFNDNESQELLKKRLFPGGRCSLEQVKILVQIAKSCKGLPLAVVLMAGILARKKKEEWEQVVKSLRQHTDGDLQNLSMGVLELSYKNLPDYLRPCFLYLGAFPEDKEIPTKKLTWLWVAEGFIQKYELKSLEDTAKDYLMDLIDRSLVMIAERGTIGEVKACRIHDLLRSFTLATAKRENFLLLLDGNDEHFAPDQQEYGQMESYNSNPITYARYRLCIYSMRNDWEKWSSSLPICSLLHFAPASLYDASNIFSRFKSLYILDLGRLRLKDFSREIEFLVHLRLLSIQIRSNSIPSSVANLRNLETFLVRGTRGEVALPNTIWSMVSLRHLHIDNRASLILDNGDVKDALLDQLETLSTPFLSYETNPRDVIRSLPNLRKLKCIVNEYWHDFRSLSQLELLKMFYHSTTVSLGRFSFPRNLKKLTLSKFRLPWSDITAIGTMLPNLEVLKLLSKAFEGEQWETSEGEFPKLKYLKLEALDIEQWNMSSEDHFPLLEKLVVHRCKQLQKIPSVFGGNYTLRVVEVKWCNESAANSAKDICKEQKEYGNEELKVDIHPYPSEPAPASSS